MAHSTITAPQKLISQFIKQLLRAKRFEFGVYKENHVFRQFPKQCTTSFSSLKYLYRFCHRVYTSSGQRTSVRRFQAPLTLICLVPPFPLNLFFTSVTCEDSKCNCGSSTNPESSCFSCRKIGETTAKKCPESEFKVELVSPSLCAPCNENDKNGNTPINWCEAAELSHKALVRQACQLTVDSVTRILGETISAYQDYHDKYRCLLDTLIEALESARMSCGTQLEVLDCKLILIRSEVEKMKGKILELESFLCSLQRLADAAAETAFLGHAEYYSIAMSERVQSVAREMKSIKEITLRKERDMIELQSVVIIESGRSLK